MHHHPGNRVKFRQFSTDAPAPAACGQINTKSDEEGHTRGRDRPPPALCRNSLPRRRSCRPPFRLQDVPDPPRRRPGPANLRPCWETYEDGPSERRRIRPRLQSRRLGRILHWPAVRTHARAPARRHRHRPVLHGRTQMYCASGRKPDGAILVVIAIPRDTASPIPSLRVLAPGDRRRQYGVMRTHASVRQRAVSGPDRSLDAYGTGIGPARKLKKTLYIG